MPFNFILTQVDPDSRPSTMGPAFTGHFRITADTPRGLTPFQPNIPVNSALAPQQSANGTVNLTATKTETTTTTKTTTTNLSLSSNILDSATKPAPTPADKTAKKPTYNCSTCSVDCSTSRYHCTTNAQVDLCPICYLDGRFSSTNYSGDFVRIDKQEASVEHTWTDQETLLLLEGLEMYGEDWNKVSSHVGPSKTREECICKFLQLPIEEQYVDTTMEKGNSFGKFGRVPLSSSDNPVLSLVAYLAGNVDPKVAAGTLKF